MLIRTDSLTFFHVPIFLKCTVRLVGQIRYTYIKWNLLGFAWNLTSIKHMCASMAISLSLNVTLVWWIQDKYAASWLFHFKQISKSSTKLYFIQEIHTMWRVGCRFWQTRYLFDERLVLVILQSGLEVLVTEGASIVVGPVTRQQVGQGDARWTVACNQCQQNYNLMSKII